MPRGKRPWRSSLMVFSLEREVEASRVQISRTDNSTLIMVVHSLLRRI